jgi:hypothetical protein
VQVVARPFGQPAMDQRRLVGGGVVEHEMHLQAGRHAAVDQVEEGAELPGAVPLPAGADDLPRLHVQRGEQVGGAVPDVIVGAPLDLAGPRRQHRGGALERLDGGLLVMEGFSSTHSTRARAGGLM